MWFSTICNEDAELQKFGSEPDDFQRDWHGYGKRETFVSSVDQTQSSTKAEEGPYNWEDAGSAPSFKGELALDLTSALGEWGFWLPAS